MVCGAEGFGSLPGALEALRGRRWGSLRALRMNRDRQESEESAAEYAEKAGKARLLLPIGP